MARKQPSLRDRLVGSMVLVNDKAGDAYSGLLVAADGSMVRLERSGQMPVKFHDGKSKNELVFDWVNIPASEVKFVSGAG